MAEPETGGCLCGGVRFAVDGELRPVIFCHCEQCRRTSGHFVAATACAVDAISLTAEKTLVWYRSSEMAERGFCNACGASLFWKPGHGRYICVMAGMFDDPNVLTSSEHIYCEGISNYYSIDDGLPQRISEHNVTGFYDDNAD